MKTMKIKMFRLILVLFFPAVLLTAVTGCQDSTKSDGTPPGTNVAPAKP